MNDYIKKYRNLILLFIDIIIIIVSYFFTYFFKNQSFLFLSSEALTRTIYTIILTVFFNVLLMKLINLYNNITRFETAKDYIKYTLVAFWTACFISVLQPLLSGYIPLHGIRTNLLAALLISIFMIAYRVIIRMILTTASTRGNSKAKENRKNLLIIGAGSAAREVISTIERTLTDQYKVVGLIDDNKFKKSYSISNNKILGDRNDIVRICGEYNVEEIFFAISNIDPKNKKEILNICQETKAKVKVLPGVEDIIKGKNITENLRDVEIEDLLGRDPIKLDNSKIEPLIKGEVVLVTGAGGSIGSELCRQIITYNPKLLVMLDIYENTLYDIQMELIKEHTNIKAIIGSIRDKKRLAEIMKEYKPTLIFNAAAHKHVPLMEASPLEAIKNNIFGTWNLINVADEYNVRRFIQISTDKAVNPTNIMGATKRMCELMIQAKDKVSKTEYAAVRFGNVLGSNGSVIPLFKKQIKEGGPVTLTHKDIIRYFMTIPEAVSLVIQAMALAKGGEIFVLDMGKPVKIYDLAKTLIKLSGYEPELDIPIKITGLRPGEKLYEELLISSNELEKTKFEKIFIEEPNDITVGEIDEKLESLQKLVDKEDSSYKEIKEVIHKVVPTFIEPEKANSKKEHLVAQ